MFSKLPSAWFCGVRLKEIDEKHATVTVPYKWLSQNPFHSIYFACQAMAAEMSTGVLAMGHLYKMDTPVSMLVTSLHAVFTKKAQSKIYFTCNDGIAIKQAIEQAISTGDAQKVTACSSGYNAKGELIGEFKIEWSFKTRR